MKTRIALPKDPFSGFQALYEALEKDRRWWRDSGRLRYAAMAALGSEGDPATVARGIRSTDRSLREASPWYLDMGSQLRFAVAATLYQIGDSANAFMKELVRVRKMFRAERLPRTLAYELIAVLILRIQNEGGPISLNAVQRLREIYSEMKRHHRWITGADDLPACALLTGQEGTPQALVDKTEAIYGELKHRKFQTGNPLQTAANVLSLAQSPPPEVADRAARLKDEFKRNGVRTYQRDYDELAILSFLNLRADSIVDTVLGKREQLKKIRPRIDRATVFNLAAAMTFIELAGREVGATSLGGTKALMDMQAVIAAQQATLVCAAGAAAAASASS
jgi:hypothetical protein